MELKLELKLTQDLSETYKKSLANLSELQEQSKDEETKGLTWFNWPEQGGFDLLSEIQEKLKNGTSIDACTNTENSEETIQFAINDVSQELLEAQQDNLLEQEMETENKEEEVEQKQEMTTDKKEEEEEQKQEMTTENKEEEVEREMETENNEEEVEQEMETDSKEEEVEQEMETDSKEEESTQKDKRRKKKNKNVVAISV